MVGDNKKTEAHCLFVVINALGTMRKMLMVGKVS